jgi:sulfatase maturation enzyme AslB (radical SAM superfamily)
MLKAETKILEAPKQKQLLGKTLSICPKCLRMTEANIVEEDNKIYLIKDCCEHTKYLLENDANFYKNFYLPFTCYISEKINVGEFYLDAYLKKVKTSACPNVYITNRCNMDCPICFTKNFEKEDISLEDFEVLLKLYKGKTISLSGGEPTCHPQFFEILKLAKKYKKDVWVLTNGLKFADYKFCMKIKKYVSRVCISFDGWNPDIYYEYRGDDSVLKLKLKALQNLKELKIPTNLFVVVGKENLKEVADIIYFSASKKNKFIKDLWLICKYPDSDVRSSDIAKEICKAFDIPLKYFYELKRLKWNVWKVFFRFKLNKEYVDTDMLYDIMFFRILNPSIEIMYNLEYLSSLNQKLESLLKDKTSLFFIKLVRFLPEAIKFIVAKFNHKFRRKYLAITLSRIISPLNVDFLRDNNMGLDSAVARYSKGLLDKKEVLKRIPVNVIVGE